MNLKLRNCLVLVCFCMFGVQTGLSFVAEMRDLMNNCARDGGYCINTLLPKPPPKPVPRRVRKQRRRPTTRTRKGQRQKPSPRALGAQNTVLPGGRRPAPPVQRQQPAMVPQQNMNYAPPAQPVTPAYTDPFSGMFNFGGSGTSGQAGGGFDPFFGMMMFTRKKRQAAAPVEPFEPGEAPIRMPGQTVFAFLNQHCLKSEPDFFGCKNTGGFCCIPMP